MPTVDVWTGVVRRAKRARREGLAEGAALPLGRGGGAARDGCYARQAQSAHFVNQELV